MTTHITVFNHSVQIETSDSSMVRHIENFVERFYTVINKGFGAEGESTKVEYVSKINNSNVWYMLLNQFKHFLSYLREQGYDLGKIKRTDEIDYKTPKIKVKVRKGWKLRDEQEAPYEFLVDGIGQTKLLPLSTGVGKSILALFGIKHHGMKAGILILPQFIEKWIEDITETYEASADDILVIQGGASITGVVDMVKKGTFTQKYVIFSIRTIQNLVKEFEENPETCYDKYGIYPIELFPLLGLGVLLVDETHMSFHSIFKIICHTNVKQHIGLSATLISEDSVVSRAHKVMYPTSVTYEDKMQKRYMDAYPVEFTIDQRHLRLISTTQRGSKFYSHTAYEQSIMRNKHIFDSYYLIIKDCVDDYYLEPYMQGDKLVIFVSMIKMANKVIDRLRQDIKGKKIVRYCMGDSYDDMMSADIIVSTIGSLGTGVTVPNLRTIIQTVSISSPVSNIQSAGRLRYLKDRDVKFCTIHAGNISKHREYNKRRLEALSDRIKSVTLRKAYRNL